MLTSRSRLEFGLVVGAITTAAAFLTMMVSENAGMKEFGFVSGSGLLFCLLALSGLRAAEAPPAAAPMMSMSFKPPGAAEK